MLKGVNKLIVEVSNPDSEFFEKAIFFIKPQMKDTPQNELNKSADDLLVKAERRRAKKGLPPLLKLAGAAGFGAAVAAVLSRLLM